ncbi:MAG: DivIVA domain-containing protein [Thermodesulfobacteriota bacterium]|nr:DivIVA domain-containing protein [Thermodesulfobacteriota bacterium]
MPLTAEDIQAQQFHVRFRGFDVEDVDAFLERVAEDFLILTEKNQQLKEQVKNLSKEIDSFKTRERTFQDAILTAQKIADEMKKNSREEADTVLTKARDEADEILTQARVEARQIEEDANAEITLLESNLDRLKGDKARIVDELRSFLKENLKNLENEKPLRSRLEELPPDAPKELPAAEEPEIHNAGATESAEPEKAEDDLSDLYEKIDLDDMESPSHQIPEHQDPKQSGQTFPAMGGMGEDFDQSGPKTDLNLDGEMTFSLDDPLDDSEPSVVIDKE